MMKKFQKLLPLLTFCFSILVFASMFFNVLQTDDNEAIMTGTKAVFGGAVAAFGPFASAKIQFSFPNLIGFFLPAILALGLVIYSLLDKKPNSIKMALKLLIVLSFGLSIFLLAYLPQNTKGLITIFGDDNIFNYEGAKLAVGAILGICFASLGFLSSAFYIVVNEVKPKKKTTKKRKSS